MAVYFQPFYKSTVAVVIFFVQINCNFCWIYDGSIKGFTTVPANLGNGKEKIYLEKNGISHINDDSFNETFMDFRKVFHLELSENRIENVSDKAFAGFQELETIYLDRNRIRSIIFKAVDVPKLETLDIKNNQLTQSPIFYGVFQSFRHINLAGNLISHISTDDFENITNVEYINLSFNGLILSEPRQELSRLSVLDLANNNLKEIPTLQGTYNSLQQLYLQHNNISLRSLLKLKEKMNGSE